MLRHYFISYVSIQNGATTYGCTLMESNDNLPGIAEHLRRLNNLPKPPVILSLQFLTKEQYNQLSPKQ